MSSLWDLVLQNVKSKVNPDLFEEYLSSTRVLEQTQRSLKVLVPNGIFIDFIKEYFLEDIYQSLSSLGHSDLEISFEKGENYSQSVKNIEQPTTGKKPKPKESWSGSHKLNPKYLFEHFVVGKSNQFSHAAAKAVADNPSTTYNPLYIYGYSGLGKTHLLHAIAHQLLSSSPNLKLCYTTCEEFTNQFINSIRYNRGESFRERYRSVDVLLIDDIQFLSGKTQTQEEFFHTFNTLFEQQKQIILSSDTAPSDLENLESRLISRFQWGLIADISPPELETRIAILRKKAESENVEIPDNVLLYIANRIKTNVRELEGALVKLTAYANLAHRPINMDLAEHCLRSLVKDQRKTVTCDKIQRLVADYFKIDVKEILAKNNSKRVARPRQIAMYLTRKLTTLSLPEIGSQFGNKHHSTVLYSIQKVETMIKNESEESAMIETLHKSLE